jgi:hypothetical protein
MNAFTGFSDEFLPLFDSDKAPQFPKQGFDGDTFDEAEDLERLSGQLQRVKTLLADGVWRTLAEIVAEVGGSEAGVSARIRDLRKKRFGGHTMSRRRRGNAKAGIWEYRMEVRA